MCGIFAYSGQSPKGSQIIFEGLKRLEYRGYDSWGIAVVEKGEIKLEKHVGQIGKKKPRLPSSNFGVGHTRWATHGGVTVKNAHPHLDCQKQIALVHNGIVENFEQLKKKLKRDHRFASETDTEVAVHLVENYYQKVKDFPEAVRLAFKQLEGLNAILALDAKEKALVAAKSGSPLIIGKKNHQFFFASDLWALIPHTKQLIFLEDGQMAVVKDGQLRIFEIASGRQLKPRFQTVKFEDYQVELYSYPHFMLKEIEEQPKIIRDLTFNATDQIKKLAKMIKGAFGSYLLGCGTAYHAALFGQYLFSRTAKFHINPAIGSEFQYHAEFITPKSLVIALTQSGETIDIIESIKTGQAKGAKIVAMVNVVGSTVYRMSDFKFLLRAGPEKAVASTKAFIAKLTSLILVASQMAGKLEKGKRELKKAAQETEKIIGKDYQRKIKNLADRIKKQDNIFIIGRGQSHPIALEAALKIKEISYIHAEGFAGGELKHGVIALVEKRTPCLVLAPEDESYSGIISGAMEMKARGGFIIGLSSKKNPVFDHYFPISDCGEATVIPQTVVTQLLAYYLAVGRGLNPDRPRNLAKSVTVK